MSHFLLGVILPADADAESEIPRLLEPYDENAEAEPRDEDCWCFGRDARERARALAEDEFADRLADLRARTTAEWDRIEAEVAADPARDGELVYRSGAPEALEKDWAEYEFDHKRRVAELLQSQPDRADADPDCGECGGSGTVSTSYNPRSKWDWWVVGGRWNGAWSDYDPADDPANYERCNICGGSGKRWWRGGAPADASDAGAEEGDCNGCGGTGQKLKWPTHQRQEGVSAPLAALLDREGDDWLPYAFLTPDGEWHERGEMGWFGMASNEKPREDWAASARAELERYREGHVIVAVDCHI